MTDVSPAARQVYEALVRLGAKSMEVCKSTEQISTAVKLGKSQIASALSELQSKGIIERKAKEKRAGYYIVQEL